MLARVARKALLPILLAASTLLGGCYYGPYYPGYGYGYGYGYPYGGYGGYYGPSPFVGAVVIGGGRFYR